MSDASARENGALDLLQVVVGKGDVYDGIWTELQKDHASPQAEIGYLLQNQQKFDVNLNVRHFGKVTKEHDPGRRNADGCGGKDLPRHNRLCARFGRIPSEQRQNRYCCSAMMPVNKTIPAILCAEENVQGSHGAAIGELDEETLFTSVRVAWTVHRQKIR